MIKLKYLIIFLLFIFLIIPILKTTIIVTSSSLSPISSANVNISNVSQAKVFTDLESEIPYRSEKTECVGRRCILTVYSGIGEVYEDNQWKSIENAKSLKGKGFNVIYIENDSNFPLEIIDFNYTSITFKTRVNNQSLFQDIPIKVIQNNRETLIKNKRFNSTDEEYLDIIPFSFSSSLKYGFNSTIVILNESHILDDTHLESNNPTTNYGNLEMSLVQSDASARNHTILIRFNITSIPASMTIDDANLTLYIEANNLDASTEGYNISVHQVYTNYSWTGGTVTYNTRPIINLNYSSIASDDLNFFGGAGEPSGATRFNVTSIVQTDYNDGKLNTTFYLFPHDEFGTPLGTDSLDVCSSEQTSSPCSASRRPRLQITYSDSSDITSPIVNLISPSNDSTTDSSENYFAASISDNVNATNATLYIWNSTGSLIVPQIITLSSLCSQESANVSTACGGLNTGIYVTAPTWTNSSWIDEDYNTYSRGDSSSSTQYSYVNYTKPTNSLNSSMWSVKDGLSSSNLTINQSCWDYSPNTLVFRINSYTGFLAQTSGQWYCLNNTGWITLKSLGSTTSNIYEEAMIWNMSINPKIVGNSSWMVNLSVTLPRKDTYFWNYLAYDNSNNFAFNSTNWTLIYATNPSNYTINITNSLSLKGSISKLSAFQKSTLSFITITNKVNYISGRIKSVIQQFILTNQINKIYNSIRNNNLIININSLVSKTSSVFRNVIQQMIINLSPNRVYSQFKSIINQILLSFNINYQRGQLRDIQQPLTITSLINKIQGRFVSVIDNLVLYLNNSKVSNLFREATQQIVLTLSTIRKATLSIITSIQLNINNLVNRLLHFRVGIQQIFNLDSLVSKSSSFIRGVVSSLTYFINLITSFLTGVQPSGGGGGGTGINPKIINLTLCNYAYDYINNYGIDYSLIDLQIEKIKRETNLTFNWVEFREYQDNWQPYCSDAIKKTLKEEYVCSELFYFIVGNPDYSLIEVNNLRNQIVSDIQISNNLLYFYADNYETMCKYSKDLPFEREKVGNLTIVKNLTDCSLNTSLSLWGVDFDSLRIPFWKIYTDSLSCDNIKFWKWFINIEREQDSLLINGIKLGWLIVLFLIISIILIIETQTKTDSMIRGVFGKKS